MTCLSPAARAVAGTAGEEIWQGRVGIQSSQGQGSPKPAQDDGSAVRCTVKMESLGTAATLILQAPNLRWWLSCFSVLTSNI